MLMEARKHYNCYKKDNFLGNIVFLQANLKNLMLEASILLLFLK